MANVFTACWTMSGTDLGANTFAARTDMLLTVAMLADTQLKISGRSAGAAFTRLFVVPEYVFNEGAGGGLLARDDKHAIYRRLMEISAALPDLVIIAGTIAYGKGVFSTDTYNVCPVLLGGQIIAKLYKSGDDGVYQINGTFRTKIDAGKATPLIQLPNGITIGIDICMDYSTGRLAAYLLANALPPPDIHVQISGSNPMFPSLNQAKVNGVYLHCDLGIKGAAGASAWRVVTQNAVTGATFTRIQPDQTLTPGTGRVMLFTTPV